MSGAGIGNAVGGSNRYRIIPQRPRMWENNHFVLKIRRTTNALGILLFSPLKSTILETILEVRQWVAEFLIFPNLKVDWTLRVADLGVFQFRCRGMPQQYLVTTCVRTCD